MPPGRRTRRTRAAVAVALAVTLLVGGAALTHPRQEAASWGTRRDPATATATSSPTSRSAPEPSAARAAAADAGDDVTRLRGAPHYDATPREHLIDGEDSQQADLFAAAFVRRILTHDYGRPREELLSWVQAESAQTTEQLVVGLVPPELRDRFGVYSVTDTADGPAPVPAEQQWRTLAAEGAVTTVTVNRVVEPTAWSNAVDAGRIHDPGVTARQVQATLTRHTGTVTTTYSVEATLNLEGPPTRNDWRFVTLLTYTAIPTGTS